MASARVRRNPTLPQQDSERVRKLRLVTLSRKRKKYGWQTTVQSLPGVPLSTSVPYFDQPSLPWLYTLASTLIPIVENTVAAHFTSGSEQRSAQPQADAAIEHLPAIAAGETRVTDGYADIERSLVDVTEGVATSAGANPKSGFGDFVRTSYDEAVMAVNYLLRRKQPNPFERLEHVNDLVTSRADLPEGALTLEDYKKLFVVLPLPDIANHFMDDASFARMRVAGPNPMLLRAASAVPPGFDHVPAAGAALASEKLFVLDYAGLDALAVGSADPTEYLWRPVALFDVDASGTLRPVAIKLGQAADDTVVVPAPDGEQRWQWEMAKFAVQVADTNYHELFVHLARTHLVEEACAVSTYRCLAPRHPLSVLLVPHFQGTLFINNAAAGSLIADNGPIDRIFSATINSIQAAAAADRLAFDFGSSMLPDDLAARGVGADSALKNYPYRDDALLIWDALHGWLTDYVNVYYSRDQAVVADTELRAWSAELETSGKLRGFVAPETRTDLARVLTMVIFTGSAQHAAVNFTQRSLRAFSPNMTGAAWNDATAPAEERNWLAMMPPIGIASEQLRLLALLGGVNFSKLGEYRKPYWGYGKWLLDPRIVRAGGPLDTFQSKLSSVESEIDTRNTSRLVPYGYLLPSRIPQSINI